MIENSMLLLTYLLVVDLLTRRMLVTSQSILEWEPVLVMLVVVFRLFPEYYPLADSWIHVYVLLGFGKGDVTMTPSEKKMFWWRVSP